MEKWQINLIQRNFVELIKQTKYNAALSVSLIAAKVIGTSDDASLRRPILDDLERSKLLYETLMTRKNAFNILKNSLHEDNQTGAVYILKGHKAKLQNYGLISFDKNSVLGRGSYGTIVYKGQWDNRDAAVKVLNSVMINLENAIKEVEFFKKLDQHENIVRYYFAEISDNFIYIAVELLEIDLQDEIKIKLVNLNPTGILSKCTKGLAHLHSKNILHRDLKPANILLSRPDKVKLSDFGLSKEIPDGASSVAVSEMSGTIDWMAPEILKAHYNEETTESQQLRMNKSSDIFSFGCIFYFVLSKGFHPFGNSGLLRQTNIIKNKLRINDTAIDERWMQLIKTMLAHSPKDRPSVSNILSQIQLLEHNATSYEEGLLESLVYIALSTETLTTSEISNFAIPESLAVVDEQAPMEYQDYIRKRRPLEVVVEQPTQNMHELFGEKDKYKLPYENKGLALLVNIKYFEKNVNFVYNGEDREGSEKDLEYMRKLWTGLGYEIYNEQEIDAKNGKWFRNDLLSFFENFRQFCDETRPSSIVVFIGGLANHNTIFTSDPPEITEEAYFLININLYEDIISKFYHDNCPGLKGKPKIFFAGGCETQTMFPIQKILKLDPREVEDLIVCTSQVKGFPASREKEMGSWLVYSLVFVMMKYAREKSLMEILEMVAMTMQRLKWDEFPDITNGEMLQLMDAGMKELYFFMQSE